MFSVTNTFYNQSIRKIVLGFGALFDSVYITRYNSDSTEKDRIRVPLAYGSKEKFILKLTQESSLTKDSRVQIVLPKLGFEITTLLYDPTRKVNRLIKRSDVVNGVYQSAYSEVPYNIGFSLFAYTRNMDDMLQIIEQIVPFFAPEYMMRLKMNNLYQEVDIPIVLNGVSLNEDYEGSFDSRRVLISSFDFTAKAYIYPQICGSTGGIIERTDVNLYDDTSLGDIFITDVGYTGNHITGSITPVIGPWP
jgi:hypothetical protein